MVARFRPRFRRSIAGLLVAVGCAFAQQPPARDVRNFGKVNKWIFRGAEPSSAGIGELGAIGVKTVVDLRLRSSATLRERRQVQKLGMKYVSYPLAEFSAPTKAQVADLLSILAHADSGPIFVHCRRGKDRTGTIIACYRIEHDHWTNKRALAEANAYGMSHFERGMRSFIAHFQPIPLTQIASRE